MNLSKKRSFASIYFIFLKNLFQSKNLWKSLTTQMYIIILIVSAGVSFEGVFFTASIPNFW